MLPRPTLFLLRYGWPCHRHGDVTYVCVPPSSVLSASLDELGQLRHRHCFCHPPAGWPFFAQLSLNAQAFVDYGDRSLGVSVPVQKVLQVLEGMSNFVMPTPPTPSDPVNVDLLRHQDTPVVYTASGWRPMAGGFRHRLSQWQFFHRLLSPLVLAVLTGGAWLRWREEPPPPLWLAQVPLTEDHQQFVAAEITALLLTGAIRPYDATRRGLPVFIGSLLVSQDSSGKMRLLWDPRYVNGYLHVPKMRLEALQSMGLYVQQACYMLKIDLKAGYHHVMMAERYAPYLTFIFEGVIYWWAALPFGVASAPALFEAIMCGMKQLFRKVWRLQLLGYLDDITFVFRRAPSISVDDIVRLVGSGSSAIARQDFLISAHQPQPVAIVLLLLSFGATINVKKLLWGQEVEMLGIIVDAVRMEYRVPERRWLRLQDTLRQICTSSRQQVKTLACAAGQLVSMAIALRHARTLLWGIFYAIMPYALQSQWRQYIQVPEEVLRRCEFWLRRFSEFNGTDIHPQVDMVIDFDASMLGSGGALYHVLPDMNELTALAHRDRPLHEQDSHNNIWEFWAAVDTVLSFLPLITGRRIILRGDNVTANSYIRRGGGRSPLITAVAQRFHDLLIAHGVDLVKVEHLPGLQNVIADDLSRYQDTRGDWSIKREVLQDVLAWMKQHDYPIFTIDAFASELNHVCDVYCSRWREPGSSFVNFFDSDFSSEEFILWCNPPFSLLGRVLLQWMRGHYRGYVVAPEWQEQPWWLPLMERSRDAFLLPPDSFTSVMTAHESGFHPPAYDIYVHFVVC